MTKSIMTIDDEGTKRWINKSGELHREDGPAVEYVDGTKIWIQNGKCHRLDGPAAEMANGSKHWYKDGKLHRADGPAIEWGTVKLSTTWYHNNHHLGQDIEGFWKLWDLLNEEERQNVNLHMWLRKLTTS